MSTSRRQWLSSHRVALAALAFVSISVALVPSVQSDARTPITLVAIDLEQIEDPSSLLDHVDHGTRDPFLSELAIQLGRRILDRNSVTLLGTEDLYELTASPKIESIARHIHADLVLSGYERRSRRGAKLFFRLDEPSGRNRAKVRLTLGPSTSTLNVAAAIAQLFRDAGVVTAPVPIGLGDLGQSDDLSLLRRTYTATVYRCIGKRFADPSEARFLDLAELALGPASVDPQIEPLDTAMERVALLLRRYNLSSPREARFAEEGRALLDVYAQQAEQHRSAPYLTYRAIYDILAPDRRAAKDLQKDLLRKALEYDPNYAEAHFTLGWLGGDAAVEHFREVARLTAGASLKGRTYLAKVLAESGDTAAARREFEGILEARDYPLAYYHKARMDLRDGRIDEAYASLSMIETSEFYKIDAFKLRSLIELKEGRFDEAEISLVSALTEPADLVLRRIYEQGASSTDPESSRNAFVTIRDRLSVRIQGGGEFDEKDEVLLGLALARLGDPRARDVADALQVRFPEHKNSLVWIGISSVYRIMGDEASADASGEWAAMELAETKNGTKAKANANR